MHSDPMAHFINPIPPRRASGGLECCEASIMIVERVGPVKQMFDSNIVLHDG
jgi:hypothetical protein